MKFLNNDSNIITKALSLIMILLTGYLSIVSLFSTAYISEDENLYYIKDNALINIAIVAIFLITVLFLKDKISKLLEGNEAKLVLINSIILTAILVYFVLSTKLYPLYDQAKLLNVVKQLNRFDYSAFIPGGYEDRCRVQWGITVYFYIISRIFGNVSITAIQLLNVFYIIVSNFLIYRISSIMFSKKSGAIIHLAVCLFVSQWFYSSFVYGTLPSFMFALLATYIFMKEKASISGKIVSVAIASLSISIAILLKTNSLIILIAVVLILAYNFVRNAKAEYLASIMTILIIYVLSSKGLSFYINDMTRFETGGIPNNAYITMGLMENSDKGPGWYNGFNDDVYIENEFNNEKASAESAIKLKELLNGFKNNPANLVSFISRKTVSQWNEPTFESLYILYKRDSLTNTPVWFKNLSVPTSNLNKTIREIMNIIHILVLFGAFSYFVLEYKNITIKKLVLAVIIIGGFLFHTVWEAKSQYILVYFMLLIPYAVAGYSTLAVYIKRKTASEVTIDLCKLKSLDKLTIYAITLAALIALTAIVPDMSILGKLLKPSWKTEDYKIVTDKMHNNITYAGTLDKDYIEGLKVDKNLRLIGRYYVKDAKSGLYLTDDESGVALKSIDEPKVSDSIILFENKPGSYIIRFQKTQKVLDVMNGVIKEGSPLHSWEYNGDMGQCFILNETSDNEYSILCGDFALKATDEGIILTGKDDKDKLSIVLEKVD